MPESESSSRSQLRSRPAWIVLFALLGGLLLGALSFDPGRWPTVVGDEATYLMAAQSLAWDGDLVYSREDLDRFRRVLEKEPEGLILQRDPAGELHYAKPVFYPLAIAPFVRILPRRGAAAGNVVLLAIASVLASLALERRVGRAAPLWVSCFVFASLAFAHAFWAHADLMLMGLVASALALVVLGSERDAGRAGTGGAGTADAAGAWRRVWERLVRAEAGVVAAGALVGVVTVSRPVYLALAVPLLVLAGSGRRRLRAGAGLVFVLVMSLVGNLMVRGTWSSYSGERHGHYSYTGFPLDGAHETASAAGAAAEAANAGAVEAAVAGDVGGAARPSASWTERLVPFGFDLRVTLWNLVYLAVGRHVGLLPYFLPLVLGFLALRVRGSGSESRRDVGNAVALVAACGAVAAAFLILRPFNFWGGGGALANRYLLPVYPCFWFLATRPRGVLPVVVVTALAAPFLWPTWTAPRGFFRGEDGGYRHVSVLGARVLPYETTQNQLKPSGRDELVHSAVVASGESVALWVKPLTPGVRSAGDERIDVTVGASSEGILVGSPAPLEGLSLRIVAGSVGADAEVPVELGWRRVHAMWWTRGEPYFLYPAGLESALGRLQGTLAPGDVVGVRLVLGGDG